jgi:CRISPR/Cas system-associated endonuclease Cas3-HD
LSLMLRGLVRVVRGRNLENLELFVVVVVVASVVWRVRMGSLNLVLTLDLEGEVVCSNLEDSRERDRLLLGD